MTRSKHILALLVSLAALAALAPAASAATGPDPYRWVDPNPLRHSVDPSIGRWSSLQLNGIRYGSLKPHPLKRCSCESNTYRIKVVGSQSASVAVDKIKAIAPQASRFNG